jgi:GMP synthase (glutamine-hydrolysing)
MTKNVSPVARPRILIVDFGSQYTHLITRRVRELGVYSELVPCWAEGSAVDSEGVVGVILSGGPSSVYDEGAPRVQPWILELGVPLLGICYGLQAMAWEVAGERSVARSTAGGEYGSATIERLDGAGEESLLLEGLSPRSVAWMSHGDRVETLPPGFRVVARSEPCPLAAIEDSRRRWYGIQFHPEVHHTREGLVLLRNFLFRICGAEKLWEMGSFAREKIREIRERVGPDRVVLGLSGGVDSSVAAVLVHEAIGDQLTCIFVDHGLLRAGETQEVRETFEQHFHLDLRVVDAREKFLGALAGVGDPEEKRRIIGRIFVEVFEEEAHTIPGVKFLGQGTLYPDVIESVSPHGGPSVTIKTHHNVGGLPERLGLALIEPLRELFKDEVRRLGRELGVPESVLARHPFPGPGLAVRCLGPVSDPDLEILREADRIAREELNASGYMARTSQAFVVLLPVRSVGVQGDARTYERVAALRVVETPDFMTADWADLPRDLLSRISNRIINEVRGINRVVYDISSKPPATIEWE